MNLKTASCGYIYADGHVVIVHEENHAKAGRVQWVEVIEKIDAHCGFTGRIIFHGLGFRTDARFGLAISPKVRAIRANEPTLKHGSDATRKLGLEVGTFTLEFKDGGYLHWNTINNVLSDGLTYQPSNVERFRDTSGEMQEGSEWFTHRIVKIHRRPVDTHGGLIALADYDGKGVEVAS